MDEIRRRIADMLEYMQQCYVERNPGNAAALCGRFFDPADAPVLVGTSNSEWCLTMEEIRELFVSDWEGWGDVVINPASLICGGSGPLHWFSVGATVSFRFADTDQRYTNYMAAARRVAEGGGSAATRAGHILWVLSHLLHARAPGERAYLWDITLSGVVRQFGDGLKVQEMQFSFPMTSVFPDVRIDLDEAERQRFREECAKVAARARRGEGAEPLHGMLSRLFEEGIPAQYAPDAACFDGDGQAMGGEAFAARLRQYRQTGVTFSLLPETLILGQAGGCFWFCGLGTVERAVSLEEELGRVLGRIGDYDSQPDTKEALYRLRRDLAHVMKEALASDRHVAPFRGVGLGRGGEDGTLCLEYFRITYPFQWILEQKNEAQRPA